MEKCNSCIFRKSFKQEESMAVSCCAIKNKVLLTKSQIKRAYGEIVSVSDQNCLNVDKIVLANCYLLMMLSKVVVY